MWWWSMDVDGDVDVDGVDRDQLIWWLIVDRSIDQLVDVVSNPNDVVMWVLVMIDVVDVDD